METARKDDAHGGTALLVYTPTGMITWPLPAGTASVIGRTAPADLVIEDTSLSREHARFVHAKDGSLHVEDLGSTNGTLVRGNKITRAALSHGVDVRVGEVVVVVHHVTGGERDEIESYDEFLSHVDEELVRARTFGRSLGLFVVGSTPGRSLAASFPQVRALARSVDRFGFYSPTTRLWLLPELPEPELEAFGIRIRSLGLQGGYALGPRDGASSAELLEQALQAYRGQVRAATAPAPSDGFVPSVSPKMHALKSQLDRVAPSGLSVLLHGETGVGKDVFARMLHQQSGRTGEFRAINCGAIAPSLLESTLFGHEKGAFTGALKAHKGIFEQAQGGTVFLDEIAELPAEAQVALLRVLENRTVQRVGTENEISIDVRIVAATHQPLDAMVEAGTFRRDLLFRLDGFSATVPPLRDRPEDIPALTMAFIREANQRHGRRVLGVSPLAEEMLRSYSFPGNVRELKNSIDRAVVLSETDTLEVASFPDRMRDAEPPKAQPASPAQDSSVQVSDLRARLKIYERGLLRDALRQAGGSRAKAAEHLQIPLRTLFNKLKDLGIDD